MAWADRYVVIAHRGETLGFIGDSHNAYSLDAVIGDQRTHCVDAHIDAFTAGKRSGCSSDEAA